MLKASVYFDQEDREVVEEKMDRLSDFLDELFGVPKTGDDELSYLLVLQESPDYEDAEEFIREIDKDKPFRVIMPIPEDEREKEEVDGPIFGSNEYDIIGG